MRTALIVGIDSMIGSALREVLVEAGWCVFGTSRRKGSLTEQIFYLDLMDATGFKIEQIIDTAFLCGGLTKIVDCEQNSEYSRVINVDAQIQLAKYFLKQGTQVVYLSSNAVFSGEKPRYKITDMTCPVTQYGEYKAIVEKKLLSLSNAIAIVRLTKVLSSDYPLIIHWINALKKGECIEPFSDYYLSPISLNKVIDCLKKVGEQRLSGVIHLSGEEDVSYFDLALCLVRSMGVNKELIESKSVIESGQAIGVVSRYTSLDMTESKRIFDIHDSSFSSMMDCLYGCFFI